MVKTKNPSITSFKGKSKRKRKDGEWKIQPEIVAMLTNCNKMLLHIGGKFVDGGTEYEGGKVYKEEYFWRECTNWARIQHICKACRVSTPVYVCYFDPVDGQKIPLRTDLCVEQMFSKYEYGTTITLWATGKFYRLQDRLDCAVNHHVDTEEEVHLAEVDHSQLNPPVEDEQVIKAVEDEQLMPPVEDEQVMPLAAVEEIDFEMNSDFWDVATQCEDARLMVYGEEGGIVNQGEEVVLLEQGEGTDIIQAPRVSGYEEFDIMHEAMGFTEERSVRDVLEELNEDEAAAPQNVREAAAPDCNDREPAAPAPQNENEPAAPDCNDREAAINEGWGEVPVINEESVHVPSDDLHSICESDDDDAVTSNQRGISIDDLRSSSIELFVGQEFVNAEAFRNALTSYTIRKKFDFHWVKSESYRVTAKCVTECGWRIHASRSSKEMPITIKTFNGEHSQSCPEAECNKKVTSNFLASKYVHRFRDDPHWRYSGLQSQIHDDLEVDVSRFKLMRAKRKALSMIEGNAEEQYANLREYAALIEQNQPGSYVRVKEAVDGDGTVRFLRIFYTLGPLLNGFKAGCRPFIGLDACFLKTRYKGQLISAVGRDANDSFYPIAFAVVEIENIETWTWFMHHLIEVLGDIKGITWISDRQKGLQDIFTNMLPDADHRFCIIHIYDNFKKKWSGAEMRNHVMNASYSYTLSGHQIAMSEVFKLNEEAHEYLTKIPLKWWCKHAFNGDSKCDLSSNNMCESWNKKILDARDKPIIYMFEMIRKWLMVRYELKRSSISNMDGFLTPEASNRLNLNKQKKRLCKVHYAGHNKYEVVYNGINEKVDLKESKCSCNVWTLTGIPCVHACASLMKRNLIPEDYVSQFHLRSTWLKSYEGVIEPLCLGDMRRIPNMPKMLPPIPHVQTGRPSKARKKQANEQSTGSALGRQRAVCKCSHCHQYGHTARSCKNPAAEEPLRPQPVSKGGRPRKDAQPHMYVPTENTDAGQRNTIIDTYVTAPRLGRGGRGGRRGGRTAGRRGGRGGIGGVAS